MEDKVEKNIPWLIVAQRAFLNSFVGNYEIEMLEWLRQNIDKELEKVWLTNDLKTAKRLLEGIEYFYNHFCRIWQYHNQFSSDMKSTWMHILSSITKMCLFLSRGMKKSKWIKRAVNVIKRFPGEKHLIYDALLIIHSVDVKHRSAYAAILKALFMDMPLFVPVKIDDPAEFMKVYFLVRRLRLSIMNQAERAKLQLRASKILAPPSLWDWLLDNGFNVAWTRKGIKKVNLGINIGWKLGGVEKRKILKKLRKILLPGLCTKIKTAQQEQCDKNCFWEREYFRVTSSGQFSSEDDKEIKTKIEDATVTFSAKVPSAYQESAANKRKKRKNCVSMPCTDQILSEDDKEHNSTVNTYDNDELATEKKSKKRRKSVALGENQQYRAGQTDLPFQECSAESVKIVTEKIKRQRKLTLNKMAGKILNPKNEIIDKDSCLLKEVKKQREMISEKKQDHKDNSEPKSDPTPFDHSLQEDISHTANVAKSRRKKRKRRKAMQLEGTEETAFHKESDVKNSPMTVAETPCDHSLQEDISQTASIAKSSRKKQKRRKAMQLDVTEETLADLQDKDLSPKSNLRLKNTDKSYTPEEAQGSCGSSSSDLQEPIFDKEIRNSSDNQISRNVNGQDCMGEDGDNVISATTAEHTGRHIIQMDEEFLQDSAVKTEILDCSLNQTSGLLENCEGIKPDLTSEKLTDENEKIPVQTGFENVTVQMTNNSPEAVSLVESHGSSVSVHSSLNSDSSTQAIEVQKNGHPSIESDELFSVDDKVNFLKTNSIGTENNVKVFVKSELPFKNNSLPCEVEKKEITQENRVSGSLIDSRLKTHENVLTISSPEKIENNCNIKINSEAPLENSVSNLLENKTSLNSDDSSQEIVIKEEKLASNEIDCEVVYDSNSNSSLEIDSLEVKRDSTDTEIQRPSQNNFFYVRPLYPLTGLFVEVKSPIFTPVPLDEDSESLLNYQRYDPASQDLVSEAQSSEVDTPNTSAAKAIVGRVLLFAELAGNQDHSIRQNINEGDSTPTPHSLPVNNLFLTPSVENGKPAECLSFSDISIESVGSLNACHTPESSEFLQYRDLFNRQDDNKSEDTLSESKSVLKTDGSESLSDIGNHSEDEESDSSSRNCYFPEAVPDASNFKSNCETYVVKTECSWDDAITRQRFCMGEENDDESEDNDDESEDNDDDEHDTRCSENNQTDISTKMMQLKGWMLNPVVNLGERCDSKSFVDMNASESTDSLSIPINSSVLPVIKAEAEEASVLTVIKAENEETNVVMPFDSNQSSLTVDKLSSPVNETGGGLEAIEQSMSIAEQHDEICNTNNDVKIDIQPEYKAVKEPSLTTDQKLAISSEDQNSIELSDEKDISHNHKATKFDNGPKSPSCYKDQETVKLKKDKELSQDHKATEYDNGQELAEPGKKREFLLGMELRNRFATEVKTENSMVGDESSNILNHDTPPTPCMNLQSENLSLSTSQGRSASDDEGSSLVNQNTSPSMNLRSRNPSSSDQGKSASDNEGSSVMSQDPSSNLCMKLRSRNPSSSSQGKSIPADENSSAFTQDTPATRCRSLRSRNPSSSSQGKSIPADEDSSVFTPATRCRNLRSRNPSASSIQEIKKHRSQTITKRSSKRFKKDVNLDFDLSGLSLNSPKALRGGKRYDSSNENSSKVVKNESPTSDQEKNPCRRLTRASVISSTVDTKMKEQDTDPDGYNLRSRKSVIMPGKLEL